MMKKPKISSEKQYDIIIKKITSGGWEELVKEDDGLYHDDMLDPLFDEDEPETKWEMDDKGVIHVDDDPYDQRKWGNAIKRKKFSLADFEVFATEAMRELVESGKADFVLLKNDKLRAWWQQVVSDELAEQARKDAIAHKKQLKEQALSKLSDEEKEALGLTKGKR